MRQCLILFIFSFFFVSCGKEAVSPTPVAERQTDIATRNGDQTPRVNQNPKKTPPEIQPATPPSSPSTPEKPVVQHPKKPVDQDSNNPAQQKPAKPTPKKPVPPTTCTYEGKVYLPGTGFPDTDNCNTCSCWDDGSVFCTKMLCEAPEPTTCEHKGKVYKPGDAFMDDCNNCSCTEDGHVLCTERGCSLPKPTTL